MTLGVLKIQPFKTLYAWACTLDLLFVRFPWWTIRNLFPSWRPRKSWPLSWCLKVNSLRYMIGGSSDDGGLSTLPDGRALKLGPGILGLYVDGVPNFVKDNLKIWARAAGIETVRVPGYWQHQVGTRFVMGEKPESYPTKGFGEKQREKVIFFLHGGGYTALSAHPDSPTSLIPKAIQAHCDSAGAQVKRTFSLEYRLSSTDPNPRANSFPAALLDALAGYAYLVNDVGFQPSDIIVAGDSAGGNLALALTRYLVEQSKTVSNEDKQAVPGPPGGMILLSPWADVGVSHSSDPGRSDFTNARSDFLKVPELSRDGVVRLGYASLAFTGPHGQAFADTNVYASPASLLLKDYEVSFAGFPPTFVSSGGGEMLVDQIRTLVRRMRKDMGKEKVEYLEAEDAIHDFLAFSWVEPQRTDTLRAIGQWCTKL